MISILLTLSVVSLSSALIRPPIPVTSPEPGIVYHPRIHHQAGVAMVTLEVFLDLNCPDSLAAWPVIKQLAQHYPHYLKVLVHQLPLPYHRNSFLSSQGLYLVHGESILPSDTWHYLEAVLEDYDRFSTANTVNMSDAQVLEELANLAIAVTNVDYNCFVNHINQYRDQTTQAWKYGVKRGAAGTPWYFVNGVDLQTSSPISLQEWIEFLDPLMEQSLSNSIGWLGPGNI